MLPLTSVSTDVLYIYLHRKRKKTLCILILYRVIELINIVRLLVPFSSLAYVTSPTSPCIFSFKDY